jgi:hypothetical protein
MLMSKTSGGHVAGAVRRRHEKDPDSWLFSHQAELTRPITYYWTGLLILDNSYLVGNLTNSKIAETKALEPLKS